MKIFITGDSEIDDINGISFILDSLIKYQEPSHIATTNNLGCDFLIRSKLRHLKRDFEIINHLGEDKLSFFTCLRDFERVLFLYGEPSEKSYYSIFKEVHSLGIRANIQISSFFGQRIKVGRNVIYNYGIEGYNIGNVIC